MSIQPICLTCKHLDRTATDGQFRCTAFLDAIPEPILVMEVDHHFPYPGDHGIRFEPQTESAGEPK